MSITISIPCTPQRILSPNGSRAVHWGSKTKVKNKLQHDAYYAARNLRDLATAALPTEGPISYRIVIGWEKGRKQMDDDNAIAACKAMQDGICAALEIDDKRLRLTGITQVRDQSGVGVTHFVFGDDDEQ